MLWDFLLSRNKSSRWRGTCSAITGRDLPLQLEEQSKALALAEKSAGVARSLEARIEEVDLELDEAQQYLQLEQAAESAFILDCDLHVELWNAAAARATGHMRGEVVGKPLRTILASDKVCRCLSSPLCNPALT